MNKKLKQRLDPVEVYSRIRPLQDHENERCVRVLDESSLLLQIPESSATYRSGQAKQLVYSFTQIFDEDTSQQDIYNNVGYSLVNDVLLGKNGLLFTYGVTSSGKTHTMLGNPNDPGLLQRCLDTIFSSISFQQAHKYTFKPDKQNGFEIQTEAAALLEQQRRDILQNMNTKGSQSHRNKAHADAKKLNDINGRLVDINDEHVYAVFISCIEIYNNYIYDLLDDLSDSSSKRTGPISDAKESKSLKEDSKGSMYIKDSVEIEVKSTEEALELMHRAQKKRVVASTDLNAESSRSHSIFNIRIAQTTYDSSASDYTSTAKAGIHVSQLSLVDLAGSERTKRTKNTGSRLREAGNINSSLMALRNCMEALRENVINSAKKIVPYRDSKLTLLFKNYFEEKGKIKMILCLNPSAQEFDETINVLKFSELIKDVLVPVASEIKFPRTNENENNNNNAANQFLNDLLSNNYHLLEGFPPIDVQSYNDCYTLRNLTNYLEEFSRNYDARRNDLSLLYQQLNIKVREVFTENEQMRHELAELRQRLEIKERNEIKLDNKIRALERVINNTRTPARENIRPIISDNDLTEKKRNRELDIPSLPFSGGTHTPLATYRSNLVARNTATATSSQTPLQTPSSCKQFTISNPYSAHLQAQQQLQQQQQQPNYARYQSPARGTPPTSGGLSVANRRAQRRSKSADVWLDHKPPTVAKLDTVFQPKMQRKISVSKVELNDAKRSSKYLLTTQQQDSDGEIITNLIRGDIIKSPSGGANVLFTDVETLSVRNQEHPKSARKRKSSDLVINDPFTIEERCAIGIEGHAKSSRKHSALK